MRDEYFKKGMGIFPKSAIYLREKLCPWFWTVHVNSICKRQTDIPIEKTHREDTWAASIA